MNDAIQLLMNHALSIKVKKHVFYGNYQTILKHITPKPSIINSFHPYSSLFLS
jgi:hypothetical protein